MKTVFLQRFCTEMRLAYGSCTTTTKKRRAEKKSCFNRRWNHQQVEEDKDYGMQMSQIKDVQMVNVIPFCVDCVFCSPCKAYFLNIMRHQISFGTKLFRLSGRWIPRPGHGRLPQIRKEEEDGFRLRGKRRTRQKGFIRALNNESMTIAVGNTVKQYCSGNNLRTSFWIKLGLKMLIH